MCTELFLASIYFLTIIVVNYFLYKVLGTYIKKIIYLLKIQNILSTFKISKNSLFFLLHSSSITQSKILLKSLSTNFYYADLFLIGNIYKYLIMNLKKEKSINLTTFYYFTLLENQYLSKKN